MECPHLSSNVGCATDSPRFPNGTPSSWCCNVCRSNKSPWVCLTCLMVHCGRILHLKQISATQINDGAKTDARIQHRSKGLIREGLYAVEG
ncbi:hypothetical protein ATANTOWER_027294 [Ataeniobius toweri]|uniref:UBP-type domain-containing protein n=1 Tax=Ataeniobius toweri TaxID=208326 RepID=A0ABU7BUZ7_9TELE|nr:hypothetical protein [Ataeniobius toweri]